MTTKPDPAEHVPGEADEDALRPHSYDGIHEYDKRMPRWWLLTLYGSMAFSAVYWGYYHAYTIGPMPEQALATEMEENAARAARNSGIINDDVLWKMSLESAVIAAGKVTFDTTCAACHKPDLTGLIGPNLVDTQWIHGGKPMDSIKTIEEGVLAKGMPAWGAMLGKQKINEVTAYIFSHHKTGEEVVVVPGWTPPGAAPAAAPAP
jgi:cytochrome c oxidase cbb3-type subunit 3